MKKFTRTQLRTAAQDWKSTTKQNSFAPIWEIAVDDYLTYLDTYEFKEQIMTTANRATGKVKWFNEKKGFGFIVPDEGGEDIFVHFSSLNGATRLNEGDRVEFDVQSSGKGLKAVDVILL
jgi:CspA family cold shock protein